MAAGGVRVSAHTSEGPLSRSPIVAIISLLALKALVNHSLGQDVTSGYVRTSTERLRDPA